MRFIMAGSLQHAVSVAVTDCEWRQFAADRFIDQDGEEVRYLTDPDMLRGHSEDTVVYVSYEGTDSYSNDKYREWKRKMHILEGSRATRRDPPITERVREAMKAAREANQKAGYA